MDAKTISEKLRSGRYSLKAIAADTGLSVHTIIRLKAHGENWPANKRTLSLLTDWLLDPRDLKKD